MSTHTYIFEVCFSISTVTAQLFTESDCKDKTTQANQKLLH